MSLQFREFTLLTALWNRQGCGYVLYFIDGKISEELGCWIVHWHIINITVYPATLDLSCLLFWNCNIYFLACSLKGSLRLPFYFVLIHFPPLNSWAHAQFTLLLITVYDPLQSQCKRKRKLTIKWRDFLASCFIHLWICLTVNHKYDLWHLLGMMNAS